MIRTSLIVAMLVAVSWQSRAAEPLTVGSPAPRLDAKAFLVGEPVTELKRGTVYVVEFAGIMCLPCTKCIPLLTELQKKYPGVVLVSVYVWDGEKDVNDYLTKLRDKIGFRVAIDPDAVVHKAWMAAAERVGVPDAFVVDAKGTIAWIGHPTELAEPLARVVAGAPPEGVDTMRLRLAQGAELKKRTAADREKKALEVYERINAQIRGGKSADALAATEAAIREYGDTADGLFTLRMARLLLLVRQPGTRDAAVEQAVEMAVAAKLGRDAFRCRQCANAFLVAANTPDTKNRDMRFVDLAVAILEDPEAALPLNLKSETETQQIRASILEMRARAAHLRGDHRAALRQQEDAIALVKTLRPGAWESAENFKARHARLLGSYESARDEYRKAGKAP